MAVPVSSVVQLRSPANPPSLQSCLLAAERASRDDALRSLSWIVSAISSAAKGIAARLRTAGLDGALGAVGHLNVQGESQQALDVIANELLIRELESREGVMVLGSEENDELMLIDGLPAHGGRYAVLFDPLDGSSNLDVGGAVGTIFSIYQLAVGEETRLQAGRRQVAAGYQRFLADCRTAGYGSRYAGAMVADVHRVLLQGGIFLYPPTAKAPHGKLRLLYEANPIAMIVEQAGGVGSTGTQPIVDLQPASLHERVPVILGSALDVAALQAALAAH